ncbi:MAG: hypothetical protein JJT89_08490 [Nitriliruptoraceae bacterium]|nr:hypothetical protein [Nitriliruptoraceae bacterium]
MSDPREPPLLEPPVAVSRAAPLSWRQKRLIGALAFAPVVLVAVLLTPVAIATDQGLGEVVVSALMFGGLLGLAVGFVATDRFQARQCPRCRMTGAKGAEVCAVCGYDLEHRPRFTCEVRHQVYLDPGACACGRRLRPMRPVRGIGREIRVMMLLGGGLLVFLLLTGFVLQLIDRNV